MKIGGLQKLTLIDYPGKIACTVFLSGCSFNCPWCYAPELVLPERIKDHPGTEERYFFDFLEKRRKKIDGVVICGGEPTIDPKLPEFIKKIREMGFSVKLDTNGSNPDILESLLKENLLDYIAMDIKASFEKYDDVVGVEADKEKIKKSIEIVKNADIDYEFRTTLVPGIHEEEDVKKIGEMIKGAKKFFLQNFLPEKTINEGFLQKKPFTEREIENFKKVASVFVEKCETR